MVDRQQGVLWGRVQPQDASDRAIREVGNGLWGLLWRCVVVDIAGGVLVESLAKWSICSKLLVMSGVWCGGMFFLEGCLLGVF